MQPIELNLGNNGGTVRLESVESITQFVNTESDAWTWVTSPNGPMCEKVQSTVRTALNRHRKTADDIKQNNGEDGGLLGRFKSEVEEDYGTKRLIHPSTLAGQRIHQSKEEGHMRGAGALAYFQNERQYSSDDVKNLEFSRGFLEAVMWASGGQDFSSQTRATIDGALSAWRTLKEETTAQRKKWDTDFANTQQQFVDGYNKWSKAMEAKFVAIKSIQAPATYWSSKRCWHYWAAGLWGTATIAAAGVGGYWVFDMAHSLPKDQMAPASYLQALPHLFPVLLASVALFWLLRILVRLFLSNLHIATDAAERCLIIKTFQALATTSDKTAADLDLGVVWAQVFRHCPSGLARDEAVPAVPTELVTRLHP